MLCSELSSVQANSRGQIAGEFHLRFTLVGEGEPEVEDTEMLNELQPVCAYQVIRSKGTSNRVAKESPI
jgi:hypothetical protein